MDYDLARQAITACLQGDWDKALQLNQQILSEDNSNVDALNRISRIYFELDELPKAKQYVKMALEIDPLNQISQRCSEKYSSAVKKGKTETVPVMHDFIEEPGKTKIVPLSNLADNSVLISLVAGQKVNLTPSKHKVSVNTLDGIYIGKLPDDVAMRIIPLIQGGNTYEVFIKASSAKNTTVFMKETHQSPSQKYVVSFPRSMQA